MVNRQLPRDWHQRYGYRPVLLETFVETQRHRGTCYKASNWTLVGQTVGRGARDRYEHEDCGRGKRRGNGRGHRDDRTGAARGNS